MTVGHLALVPPDLPMPDSKNTKQSSHSDLRGFRFQGKSSEETWKDYEQLKSDGKLVQRWYEDMLLALGAGLTKRLNKRPDRDPTWLKRVRGDTNCCADLRKKIALLLPSHPCDGQAP